jgi:hypothetical protein
MRPAMRPDRAAMLQGPVAPRLSPLQRQGIRFPRHPWKQTCRDGDRPAIRPRDNRSSRTRPGNVRSRKPSGRICRECGSMWEREGLQDATRVPHRRTCIVSFVFSSFCSEAPSFVCAALSASRHRARHGSRDCPQCRPEYSAKSTGNSSSATAIPGTGAPTRGNTLVGAAV